MVSLADSLLALLPIQNYFLSKTEPGQQQQQLVLVSYDFILTLYVSWLAAESPGYYYYYYHHHHHYYYCYYYYYYCLTTTLCLAGLQGVFFAMEGVAGSLVEVAHAVRELVEREKGDLAFYT